MRQFIFLFVAALILISGLGFAGEELKLPENVPDSVKVPDGCVLIHIARAKGFQIYTSTLENGKYFWKVTPDAELMDKGAKEGKHYAESGSPAWGLDDGSKIVGKKEADAKHEGACALLLLSVKENNKKGALGEAVYIQRLETTGGVGPSEAASAENLGKVVRVEYTAAYYFYAKKK